MSLWLKYINLHRSWEQLNQLASQVVDRWEKTNSYLGNAKTWFTRSQEQTKTRDLGIVRDPSQLRATTLKAVLDELRKLKPSLLQHIELARRAKEDAEEEIQRYLKTQTNLEALNSLLLFRRKDKVSSDHVWDEPTYAAQYKRAVELRDEVAQRGRDECNDAHSGDRLWPKYRDLFELRQEGKTDDDIVQTMGAKVLEQMAEAKTIGFRGIMTYKIEGIELAQREDHEQ